MNIQPCKDTSDAAVLYLPQRLFLKPFAKIHISVVLSSKVQNKSISNWELMEKLRTMIQPDQFSSLRVTKASSDAIYFDGELENVAKCDKVISRLDSFGVKLNGWNESLKIKAVRAKSEFPSRHQWDSFFRDSQTMDEMKPGERPDTIHLWNLPILWFTSSRDGFEENPLPSESIFRKCFERYGKIRCIDIPSCDPFRKEMKDHITGLHRDRYDDSVYFEAYVQFSEYVAFVRAMDALRDCKLIRKGEAGGAEAATIHVDFDKSKHMTDAAIKRRDIVRERLSARQRAREEKEREENNLITKREEQERRRQAQAERDKLDKMREREERRKRKQLAKLSAASDQGRSVEGVREEKKKLMRSVKRLQSVRLLEELFKRVQLKHTNVPRSEFGHSSRRERYVSAASEAARERIIDKMKAEHEKEVSIQRDRVKKAEEGRIVLRAALEQKKPIRRASSMSSISSDSGDAKKVKIEKLTTPEREMYHAGSPYPMLYPNYGYPQYPGYTYAPPPQPMYVSGRVYYPPPSGETYAPGASRRPRGRGVRGARGRGRFPYFHGPNASHEYYKYFKKLAEAEAAVNNDCDREVRSYTRSRSRSRSRHRSRYTRSRSRSRSRRRHSRSYSRSRSRSRHRSRTRSRSRRSRSRRRTRTRSRTRSPRTHSRSRSKHKTHTPKRDQNGSRKSQETEKRKSRSKSWDMPKDGDARKSWSKSPLKE